MKITIITGSAHKNGTTAYLTEQFIKGAEEAGHKIFRFDAAFKDVHTKDRILDGKKLFEEVTYPDSFGRQFITICDGSYLYADGIAERICGEAYLIQNGTIRKICDEGKEYPL